MLLFDLFALDSKENMIRLWLDRLYGWYGKRTVRTVALMGIVLITIILFHDTNTNPDTSGAGRITEVRVASPASLSMTRELTLVGTVEAKTQAKLQAEAAGRVVAVNVSLGQVVPPGTIIAQLENASERAAVLQAEGAYEAALAGAAQSTVGVSEAQASLQAAKRSVVTAFIASYNTVNNAIISDIDKFFASPNSQIPGLRIDGQGFTPALNKERVAYQAILAEWQERSQAITESSDLNEALTYATAQVQRTISLLDTFITVFSTQSGGTRYSEAELIALQTSFTNLRGSLISTQSSLDGARTTLARANDLVERAQISASGSSISTADAQVKQALGVLRAAEANLSKTIVRSPIGGTVNRLSVRAGDYVGINSAIAEVANNSGLEVITYVSEAEAASLPVGTEARLGVTATGTITSISPAIDSVTGKVEVRIGSNAQELKTGSTVTITITSSDATNDQRIMVPLSAIKLSTDSASVFIVSEAGLLEAIPVKLGAVSGEQVEIISGLERDTPIVIDARGKKAGEVVAID